MREGFADFFLVYGLNSTVLLVDCNRLGECMAERLDTLTVRGRHSLQSTSQIVIVSFALCSGSCGAIKK